MTTVRAAGIVLIIAPLWFNATFALLGKRFGYPAPPTWLGWPGIVIGAGLAVGSAEFLGPNQERGWHLAGLAIPILYVAWSIWLLAMTAITVLVAAPCLWLRYYVVP